MSMNTTRIHFKPDGTNECGYCGLRSFEHIHEPNTKPKDFIAVLSGDSPLLVGSTDPIMEGSRGEAGTCNHNHPGTQTKPATTPQPQGWEEVIICDGLYTGRIGKVIGVGSNKHSIKLLIEGVERYEPDYALLPITEENKQAIELLVSHITTLLAQKEEEKHALVREIMEEVIRERPRGDATNHNTYNDGKRDLCDRILTAIAEKHGITTNEQ